MFLLSSSWGQEGFTFNEVLISIALIAIGILGFSLNTVGVIQGNHVSSNITIATNLAQDKMEELKAHHIRFVDMDNCPDAGDRSLTATGAPGGIYDRCWTIKNSSVPGAEGLKEVSVTVRWRDYLDRAVTLSTLVFTQ